MAGSHWISMFLSNERKNDDKKNLESKQLVNDKN